MYIFDEEKDFFIPCDVIKEQVLTKENEKALTFDRKKMDENVEKTKLPIFCTYFYDSMYKSNKIPSFDVILNEYVKKNKEIIDKCNCSIDGLKIRMSKFYVSLVRELYIRCFLKENGYNVVYNSSDDNEHDVDAWVIGKKGEQIAISIYLKSPYSEQNRKHKTIKRFLGVKYIDFAYNLDSSKKNCIYFPTKKDLKSLIEKKIGRVHV